MSKVMAIVLRVARFFFSSYVFTMRAGLARGMRRRYGLGFKPYQSQTSDEAFLARLDLSGKTVYDIGGYIGIYALFFARAVGPHGQVIAFEPNPQNYNELRQNVQLNQLDNVTPIQLGLGQAQETTELVIHPVFPARGFVARHQRANEAEVATFKRIPIQIDSLDHVRAECDLPAPDFIKIDVEGLEFDVVQGMQQTLTAHHPALFIEVHYPMPALLEYLHAQKYQLYYVEGQVPIDITCPPIFQWGHLFAYTDARLAPSKGDTANSAQP